MNTELERMWAEAVVAFFKTLSKYLPREIEGNYGYLQDNRSTGQDASPGPPGYDNM
jgi:hypothetical protein